MTEKPQPPRPVMEVWEELKALRRTGQLNRSLEPLRARDAEVESWARADEREKVMAAGEIVSKQCWEKAERDGVRKVVEWLLLPTGVSDMDEAAEALGSAITRKFLAGEE